MKIRITVEESQRVFIATSYDEVGRIISASNRRRSKAIELVKAATEEQFNGTIEYTVEQLS